MEIPSKTQNKKGRITGLIVFVGMKSGLFSLELFLDFFDVDGFENRLEILDFQSLSSLCGYRFILTVFAL
mgnify:CR=1 FL=1